MNTTFQARFMASLRKNIVDKCQDLNQLIHEGIAANFKEIQACYTSLVENLFSFGLQSDSNINLRVISNQTHPSEFQALFNFMHPDGPLFLFIRHLLLDSMIAFNFPVACLPLSSRCLIEEGMIPEMYINRLSSDGNSLVPCRVSLNAFEYFTFHLANYAHNCGRLPLPVDFGNPANTLYIRLIEVYLNYFVPLSSTSSKISGNSNSESSSLWQSLSSTTSMFLHLNSPANTSPINIPVTMPKTSLLNMKALLNQPNDIMPTNNRVNTAKNVDPFGTMTTKAETFLNILSEMWINVKLPSHVARKMPIHSHLQSIAVNNLDHIRCVRILVKHLHYFVNSLLLKRPISMNTGLFESNELDDLKRNIWTNKYVFQRRLYSFIRVVFEKWPLDASFRLPLEVWLSFIQPWRYIEPNGYKSTSDDANESEIRSDCRGDNQPVDVSWRRFVDDNLLFYTVLFRQMLPRFMRLDMSSSVNSFMLFRVVKVYNQANLLPMIRESEENFESNFSPSRNMSSRLSLISSYRNSLGGSPSHHHHGLIYRHPLLECEDNDFTYIRLFSAKTNEEIVSLLKKIRLTREEIANYIGSCGAKNDDGTYSLKSLIKNLNAGEDYNEIDERHTLGEKIKTENYLGVIYERISSIFEIDPIEVEIEENEQSDEICSGDEFSPDNIKPGGERSNYLRHRAQVTSPPLEGPFRGNIEYLGNPDKQPVRSYEFAILVKLFLALSQLINESYSSTIHSFYHRRSFLGFIVRQLLEPPTSYQCIEKHGNLVPPRRKSVHLGPRLCLRGLARKSLYYFLTVLYILFHLFGFSKLAYFLFLLTMLWVHILVQAVKNWNKPL